MRTTTPCKLGAQFPPSYHRPFLRYIDGEPGGGPTDPPKAPEGTDPAAPPAPAEPPAPPAGDAPPWKEGEFDAERAWKKIQAQKADIDAERAKREKAVDAARTEAAQAAREEAYRELGKQLGLVKEDEEPTVEGLSTALQERDTRLTAADADNLALRVENALLRFADAHGADAAALTDSSSFTDKLKALDPKAADYASEVDALVKTTVESNPRFRKVQVAATNTDGDPITPPAPPEPKNDVDSHRAAFRERRGSGI